MHGTDLLFAQKHPTQRHVLQQVTAAAAAIVVPTAAMADHLARLAPQLDPARVVNIPWGVPDQLLHAQQPPAGRMPGGDLRLLYAGRLTAEKGTSQLITACERVPGIRLSIAAPRQEYATLSTRMDLQNARVTYLGWLPRQDMWSAFGDHDLLIVPSTTLEAFGLIAVEAQACAVGGAAGGLGGLDAGLLQHHGGLGPRGGGGGRRPPAGVDGVGALVDQGTPGGPEAFPVGRGGGVGGGGVDTEVGAVDLDEGQGGEEAGGGAVADAGGAGDDQVGAAGDGRDLAGQGG